MLNTSVFDYAWVNFKVLLLKVVDRTGSFRQVRDKQRSSPWMNQKVFEILKNRDKALSIYMRTKDQEDYEKFKALGHLGQSTIKETKRDFNE